MSTRFARDFAQFDVAVASGQSVSASFVMHWAAGGMVYFPADWAEGDITLEMLVTRPGETPEAWAGVKVDEQASADVVVTAAAGAWVPLPATAGLAHVCRWKHLAAGADRVLKMALTS